MGECGDGATVVVGVKLVLSAVEIRLQLSAGTEQREAGAG